VLVFLNNDTEVHDGWLAPLVAQLADPTVGIVGARLLYPDGTVAESGRKALRSLAKTMLKL
jgi:GT2 family glycosyltransferase